MSAFRTMDPGKCAACPEPIEVGDLVVMVNDEVVHLECEDPEKAIAAVETMPFDIDDAADPVRTIIAHSMIGAGVELSPADVDRLRVILETPKQGQPDVHWPCDCVPDLGDVHCHACSTASGRTVRWADTVHAAALDGAELQEALEVTVKEALVSPDAQFLADAEVVALGIRERFVVVPKEASRG